MACKISTDGEVIFEHVEGNVQTISTWVGGHFEMVPSILPGHHAYVNEEGKLRRLPVNDFATELAHSNRRLLDDVLVGNVIIFGSDAAPKEGDCKVELLHAMQKICEGLGDVSF